MTTLDSFGQDSLYGEYRYWFIVNGYQLQINPDQTFNLQYIGNVIDPPKWTGNWSTKEDTLLLDFCEDTIGIRKHIIVSEFLLQTNLESKDSAEILYFPQYLYKTAGYYDTGNIKFQGFWESISYANQEASRTGEWKFYYEKGGIQRIEHYEKNLRHGNMKFYDPSGHCQKVEKWRKGRLKKIKDCPKHKINSNRL